ncbi:PucR family transcriptional regulator [Parasporobacterium paucivorans]|uniref:PucR C-terminal helix-turn-helix domain-containing protein n=1 Tax=Parasporobacterium paucivorans DSM 15970 TaxID=1122934 RepID=A0A1M6EPK2_9FIRM|nr:helix-turn-helix domain-containing protein [Parasporobacterium paucivorans]SHI87279.1 PucR C-terminal helix-turn-helix domain-containing protein [Parasporobacterium paucivorans DSM 15970]
MKLSLMLIHENLRSPSGILKVPELPGPFYDGVRVLPMTPQDLNANYIYVDLHRVSKQYNPETWDAVALISTQNQTAAIHSITFQENFFSDDILNQIIDIFDRFEHWENAVKEALLDKKPLVDVLNLCRMVTRETVYVTNLSLKMIAHTTPTIMGDISAIWHYQEKYGYMPLYVVKSLLDSGELDRINSFKNAFSFPTKAFNLPYTCRNIFCDNVIRAHIFIVSIYSPPLQTNKEIADVLGRLLVGYIKDNVDFFSLNGLLHEHFFRDVISGNLVDHSLIQQQLSSINWNINGGYALFVMEKENNPSETVRILSHSMERHNFECKSFEFEDNLIVVFHVERDHYKLGRIQDLLEEFLLTHHSKGAFSKWFASFNDMKVYYHQAKVIISFCKNITNNKNLFIEEEFGLYGFIKAGLENHSAIEVCHPGIIALYEHDKQNSTEYLETLFQYLVCDRNVVKAAKTLFIHRNTMNYRMERIKLLIDFNEENPDIKSYILMSIYILKYVLKTRHPDLHLQ